MKAAKPNTDQSDQFTQAARALECDESEQHFNTTLGKIVRHKPKPDAPPDETETQDEKEPAK